MEYSVHFFSCLWFIFYFIFMISCIRGDAKETCPNGDIAKNFCWNIRPHHCYNKNHQKRCCETCENFPKTNITNCRYGDHYVIWDSEFGSYTCQSYVSMLGYSQCRKMPLFRSRCCQSCHGHETGD